MLPPVFSGGIFECETAHELNLILWVESIHFCRGVGDQLYTYLL